jgi:hypothetical protein
MLGETDSTNPHGYYLNFVADGRIELTEETRAAIEMAVIPLVEQHTGKEFYVEYCAVDRHERTIVCALRDAELMPSITPTRPLHEMRTTRKVDILKTLKQSQISPKEKARLLNELKAIRSREERELTALYNQDFRIMAEFLAI